MIPVWDLADYDRTIFLPNLESFTRCSRYSIIQTPILCIPTTHSLEVLVAGSFYERTVSRAHQILVRKYPHLKEVHGYQLNDFGLQ